MEERLERIEKKLDVILNALFTQETKWPKRYLNGYVNIRFDSIDDLLNGMAWTLSSFEAMKVANLTMPIMGG